MSPQYQCHSKGKGLVIRYGSTVAHVNSVDDAASLMATLGLAPTSVPASTTPNSEVLNSIIEGATAALSKLNASFSIDGKASRNLGTALRVKQIMEVVGINSEMADTLLYISRAADGIRHLSPALISRALGQLDEVTAVPNEV